MRIFHILPDKTTIDDDQNFLAAVEAFAALGFHQAAATRQDNSIQHAVEPYDIHITPQKFGGIFDLRTKKTIQTEISAFKPHLVQGYGLASLDFAKEIPSAYPFIPLLDRNDISDLAGLQQTVPHAILVGNKNDGKTLAAMGNTISVLPPLPRTKQDKTPMVTASGNDTDAALPALPEKAYIMGFAGPLTEGLQLDPIFQAMREIPALHFLIYGTGDKERHFKDMTYKRGVHDRVHFIPSDINPAAFYDVLDLVIIPIQKQDSLRGLLQAWAYNLPVLVCDDPANTPVIEGQTGRIASPYDIFAIRHALREIIETPEKHAGIADAGTALFEQKYTQKAILGQYLNTYKKWLST